MMLNLYNNKILTQNDKRDFSIEQILYINLYTTQNTPSVQRFSEHGIYISTPLFHIFFFYFMQQHRTTSPECTTCFYFYTFLFFLFLFFFLLLCINIFQAIAIQWMATKRTVVEKKNSYNFSLSFSCFKFKSPHTYTHTHTENIYISSVFYQNFRWEWRNFVVSFSSSFILFGFSMMLSIWRKSSRKENPNSSRMF